MDTPRKPGPKPLPPDKRRSARLSMRTYPDIEAKARRLGTEGVEAAILAAPEPERRAEIVAAEQRQGLS